MLTTIEVDKEKGRSTSTSSMRDESPDKNSTESIVLLNNKAQPFGKLGGITKTTEVNIRGGPGPAERDDDAMRPERKEVHMV